MSDRPYWWDWVADRLPFLGVPFRLWVMLAIVAIDRKPIAEAIDYWRNPPWNPMGDDRWKG